MIRLAGGTKYTLGESNALSLKALAIGCARLCRYAGQIDDPDRHYSVAEHTVLMVRHLRAIEAPLLAIKEAAVHDLPEALMGGDIVSPWKPESIVRLERELATDIRQFVGLPYRVEPNLGVLVHNVDVSIRIDEMQALFPYEGFEGTPLGVKIELWSVRRAYEELVGELRALFPEARVEW